MREGETERINFSSSPLLSISLSAHASSLRLRLALEHALRQLLRRFVSRHVERRAFFEIAKPGELSFGELPGARANRFDSCGQRGAATQMLDGFLITKRLPGRAAERLVAFEKPRDFGHQSVREHLLDALIDARVEPVARG